MSLPTKKRKLSSDNDESSLPPIDMDSPQQQQTPQPRKDSGAGESAASDDTAAMALKALSALDTTRHHQPLKKRKASIDDGLDEHDDQALGLAPLGPVECEAEDTPPKSNAEGEKPSAEAAAAATGNSSSTALDHLDALGDDAGSLGSKQKAAGGKRKASDGDEQSSQSGTLSSSNQRILMEALMSSSSAGGSYRRDRFESWGGMSDLSAAGLGSAALDGGRMGDAAVALAASALHYTGLLEDVTAAAHSVTGSLPSHSSEEKSNAVPSRISVTGGDRKYSATSEDSGLAGGGSEQRTPNVQALMEAAMATMGDQLAELAGAVEMAASGTEAAVSSEAVARKDSAAVESDVSSTVSPMIGPISDVASSGGTRPRSSSASSKPLSVDYDAIAAAVDAAEAATGALDLTTIAKMAASKSTPVPSTVQSNPSAVNESTNKGGENTTSKKEKSKPKSTLGDKDMEKLRAAAIPLHQIPVPKSTLSEKEMEAVRARARAAAGYVPPSEGGPVAVSRAPLKKRRPPPTPPPPPPAAAVAQQTRAPVAQQTRAPATAAPRPDLPQSTPKISNTTRRLPIPNSAIPYPPITPSLDLTTTSAVTNRAANQKWEDMFECLLQFVKERKAEALQGASEQEKVKWEWDGHVPTAYRTKDGKALGRWVNNQRSAKSKGSLKKDREAKLVRAGLRWSVIKTSAWSDMMKELRLYVKEKTKDGQKWDGNVPTSYQIKVGGNTGNGDEEKNLGRWVNRQRSMYQSGRLRKDREKELEELGLRWSVLTTCSWESMYEALEEYVKERKAQDPNDSWDGNVPATYKTKDNKGLGRWINRQRTAYQKDKLKKEYVEKLKEIGLRWSVHERRADAVVSRNPSPEDDNDEKKAVEL